MVVGCGIFWVGAGAAVRDPGLRDRAGELPAPAALRAAQLASRILQLHSDAAENRAAAEAGLALIGEGFAAAAIASGLQAAIEGRDMLPMRTGMAARG